MSQTILYTEFNPALIKYGTIEKNKRGGKFIPTSYGPNPRAKCQVQSPPMNLPFGLTPYTDDGGINIQSYSVDASFRGCDDPEKPMAGWLAKMGTLDETLLSMALENSSTWFGKEKMSRELVTEFYRNIVKNPTNPAYSPTMKCKIACVDGKPDCKFFDEDRRPVTVKEVVQGCTVKLIVQLSSVWFIASKSYGITWKVIQLQIVSRPNRIAEEYSFVDDGTDAPAGDANADDDAGMEEF